MERLRHEGERLLLIFDNAIDANALKAYLPRGGHRWAPSALKPKAATCSIRVAAALGDQMGGDSTRRSFGPVIRTELE